MAEKIADAIPSVKQISLSLSASQNPAHHTKFRRSEVSSWGSFCRLITNHEWSPVIWSDNIRHQDRFKEIWFAAVDIDDGATIAEATEYIKDLNLSAVIAPTKSHQRPKGEAPPRDRFRLIFPFAQPIYDLDHYRREISDISMAFLGDRSCKDGARFFWRSTSVALCHSGKPYPVQPYVKPPPEIIKSARQSFNQERYRRYGQLPMWVSRFLANGEMVSKGGRNNTVMAVSQELATLGLVEDEILSAITSAPMDRHGFTDKEMLTAVRSGIKRGKR